MSTSAQRPATSAVVTGAASGIGRSVAEQLVDRGVAVSLVDLAPLDELALELTHRGGAVAAVRGDTGDRSTLRQAVDAAQALAPLTVAILNAGLLTGESDITKVEDRRFEQVVAANVAGVFRGVAEFIKAVGDGPGRVVVTSSSVGLVPAPHDPLYSMTKHAVIGFVRSLALNPELSRLRINAICPNGVDTPMLGESLKAGRALLSAGDVASRILEILASEETGQAWVCTPSKFEPFTFAPNPGYSFPTFAAVD
jgi:NAD(P)-dependent dehydrogenase (short-subunit alcohol dehydrogenase family)